MSNSAAQYLHNFERRRLFAVGNNAGEKLKWIRKQQLGDAILLFEQRLVAVSVFVLGLTAASGAFAVDKNFCKPGDSCADGLVKNKAVVIVTKTRISQQAKHGCEGVDKVVEKNLTKGGAQIKVKLNRDCRYTVKFTTTKGCTGNKQGQISRSEIEEGKTAAYLVGGCGSLSVKITTP